MMMAVSFERYGRLYYLDPGAHSPAIGDKVLVPTDTGPEVAECIWAPQWVSDDINGLPVCEGLAGDEDLARDARIRTFRAQARVTAKRLVREHGLPMKITAVDYVEAGHMLTIYFTAPQRVDFRALRASAVREGEGRDAADRGAGGHAIRTGPGGRPQRAGGERDRAGRRVRPAVRVQARRRLLLSSGTRGVVREVITQFLRRSRFG
jgi:hypothetical protein